MLGRKKVIPWILLKSTTFLKEITSQNTEEKVKTATKLHRQFSQQFKNKLCVLTRRSDIKDKEFLEILEVIPSCKNIYEI